VVVGDDVALGIDDETGAEGFTDLAVVAILIGDLAAEEAIEEVLEIVLALSLTLPLVLIIVIGIVAGVLRIRLDAVVGVGQKTASAFIAGVLGKGLGVDIHHSGADSLCDLDESIGLSGGVDHLERRGIAAVAGSFLATHSMSCIGAADDGGGEYREKEESGCEAVRPQSCI